MAPDQREFTQGLKMALVAAITAAVTATLVIGAGKVVLRHRLQTPPAQTDLSLLRAAN